MAGDEPSRVLFVGRFQPFHLGHLHMVRGLSPDFDEVILIVGSSQASHTAKNPFSYDERRRMIQGALEAEKLDNVRLVPVPDVGIHSVWLSQLLAQVPVFQAVVSHDPLTRRLFQEAGHELLDRPLLEREVYSGSEVRQRIREGEDWTPLVPPTVGVLIREIDGEARIRSLGPQ